MSADATARRGPLARVGDLLEMIKIEHTLFAAPFCFASLLVATGGRPSLHLLGWVVVALTSARAAAMAFNRLADADLDAANERTRGRHIPQGAITRAAAGAFVLISAAVFVLAASQLNRLTLLLSPIALIIVLGYSYTKRFTSLSHLVLGVALSIAPIGAWIAARGTLDVPPLALGAAVVLWVAGFDIIYACQDVDFDRRARLHSIPAAIGIARALWLSRLLHVATAAALVAFGLLAEMGLAYFVGVGMTCLLIAWEHSLVKADDLSRVNMAFFTINGAISLLILAATAADIYLPLGGGAAA